MLEKRGKKSDRTRDHLLEICGAAFSRDGFDACTLRGLAEEAGMSAASFYYYFRSKEEIVAAFYQRSLRIHLEEARARLRKGASLEENLRNVIESRFKELKGRREMLRVLRRYALEKDHLASPFHPSHRPIREASVALFDEILASSKPSVPPALRRDLAQALWLFHLGLLAYWIGDESRHQERTRALLDSTLLAVKALLPLLSTPGASLVLRPLIETLRSAGLLEDL